MSDENTRESQDPTDPQVRPPAVDEHSEPAHDPATDYKVEGLDASNVHHDEEDVPAALERETDDGKGGAVVPKADFDSYTESDADVAEEETQ